MTKQVLANPRILLDLKLCKILYDSAPRSLQEEQPLCPFEDRYEGRLESILGTVGSSYDGKFFYPTILDVAAAYLVKINIGHPFSNGNKRLSVFFTDMFLAFNGIDLQIPPKDMYIFAVKIAQAYDNHVKEEVLIQTAREVIEHFSKEKYFIVKNS